MKTYVLGLLLLWLSSCNMGSHGNETEQKEDLKTLMQGTWYDQEDDQELFTINGDSLTYPKTGDKNLIEFDADTMTMHRHDFDLAMDFVVKKTGDKQVKLYDVVFGNERRVLYQK